MDEPLAAWICLLLAMIWGVCTGSRARQEGLKRTFGRCAPAVQWYNVTFVLLLLLLLRTLFDIVYFEYVGDRFLSWDAYRHALDPNITHIPLTRDEGDFDHGSLVIPTWIRWISLLSPVAGLAAFAYAAYQVIEGIVFSDRDDEKPVQRFLHMVVLGMPLLYIVMALRATIRQWAVMTGSCWLPYRDTTMPLEQRQDLWTYLKRAEISTYTQDLEVASGFQFFAVFCFGQVCSQALREVVSNNVVADPEDQLEGSLRLSSGTSSEQIPAGGTDIDKDKDILLQLGIMGIHSFVILGAAKTIMNMFIAVASISQEWQVRIEPLQQTVMHAVDPVFLFATILSVINMLLLGRMEKVSQILPNINTKFNATRALLLIGQGQLAVLRAATTDHGGSRILKAMKQISYLSHVKWWFTMNQARLLHSSLLCFECLIVVILNAWTWKPIKSKSAATVAEAREDPRKTPLLLEN